MEGDDEVEREVAELARLVQHNVSGRLPLLEVEEMLVAWMDFQPENPVLHLPPASPYFRMLVHRLVETFGLTHVSFGEGEERHIVLQRNEDSKIPAVLLSDILNDDCRRPETDAAPQILQRPSATSTDVTPAPATSLPTLEKRQLAYEEARARIFGQSFDGVRKASPDDDYLLSTVPSRERRVPVVARRLIGRALGKQSELDNRPAVEVRTELRTEVRTELECEGAVEATRGCVNTQGELGRVVAHVGQSSGEISDSRAGVLYGNSVQEVSGNLSDRAEPTHKIRRPSVNGASCVHNTEADFGLTGKTAQFSDAKEASEPVNNPFSESAPEWPTAAVGSGTANGRERAASDGKKPGLRPGGVAGARMFRLALSTGAGRKPRGKDPEGEVGTAVQECETKERPVELSQEASKLETNEPLQVVSTVQHDEPVGGVSAAEERVPKRSDKKNGDARRVRKVAKNGPAVSQANRAGCPNGKSHVSPSETADCRESELREDHMQEGEFAVRDADGMCPEQCTHGGCDLEDPNNVSVKDEYVQRGDVGSVSASQTVTSVGDGDGSRDGGKKFRGLPPTAGKMLSHALGLTGRGWGQVGRFKT